MNALQVQEMLRDHIVGIASDTSLSREMLVVKGMARGVEVCVLRLATLKHALSNANEETLVEDIGLAQTVLDQIHRGLKKMMGG